MRPSSGRTPRSAAGVVDGSRRSGRKLETRVQKGHSIQEGHLRAWRVACEEVLAKVLHWLRLVIENYFAFAAQMYDKENLLHRPLPDVLWDRMRNFLMNLAELPCWSDKNLSTTVFGPKQNLDFLGRRLPDRQDADRHSDSGSAP